MSRVRVIVTVRPDGSVEAETQGVTGDACLDYLPLMEDLLEARPVSSRFTADHTAATTAGAGGVGRDEVTT